jgi:Tol biopolymer transport system component
MRLSTASALVLLALGPAGCNRDYPNPFALSTTSRTPSASAAIIFTSGAWTTKAGQGKEIFAVDLDGSNVSKLTNCNTGDTPCDVSEVTPAPDRVRLYARRSEVAAFTAYSLDFMDLSRSVSATILPNTQVPSGLDWSPQDGVVVYSALGAGSTDDLWRVDPNGQNLGNLTQTATVRERRPRIDPTGSVAAYERIEGTGNGKSLIYIFQGSTSQIPVTTGGPGTDLLNGTPYIVGSDTDPDYSPDGGSLVFRRLTSTGDGKLGYWDIMKVKIDGTGLTRLVTGPAYRGAPDWDARGIVFTETDLAAGTTAIVLIQADGSGRRVILSQSSGLDLGPPRWLHP